VAAPDPRRPSDEGDLLTGYRYCRWCVTRKPMDQYYWSDTRRRTRKRACNTCTNAAGMSYSSFVNAPGEAVCCQATGAGPFAPRPRVAAGRTRTHLPLIACSSR
jgi:hypothetical protein